MVRPRDLAAYGIPRVYLSRLVDQGLLVRAGRGLYSLPDADVTEHWTLVEAAKRVPHGVGCLLSALRFHELGTQNPFEVWLAVDHKAWAPTVDVPSLRIVRMSGAALDSGIETHTIEGIAVRVYGPAKTVADCFKFRNKSDSTLPWRHSATTAGPDPPAQTSYGATPGSAGSRVIRPYVEALG